MFSEIFIDRNNVEAPLDLEKAMKLRSRYIMSGQKVSGFMVFRIQKAGKGFIEHDRMIPKYNFEPGGAQAHRRMLEQFVDKWAKDECEYFHITLSWQFKDGVFEDTYKVTHRDGARGGFE